MKRKRISFLTMLMLAVILLMPASIQAAAKPGAVKLTKITAVDYNKINIKMIHDTNGIKYLDYDISFKGICPKCREKVKE